MCYVVLLWDHLRSFFSRIECWKLLKGAAHIPRHSFIMWLAIRNKLGTQEKLCKRKVIQQNSCMLCHVAVESPSFVH